MYCYKALNLVKQITKDEYIFLYLHHEKKKNGKKSIVS